MARRRGKVVSRSTLRMTASEARTLALLRSLPPAARQLLRRVIAEHARVHARGSNPVKD